MKTVLLLFSCVALAASSMAQTSGQFELRKYNSGGGMTSFWITPENSKAFGLNGSGVPAMLSIGGSSTLAGLSDVAVSSLANLDLLRYDLGSGKWVNATIASLDLLTTAAATAAYQPISSTLTTLSSATAAGLALMDDASASDQRTTLGLGTAATATLATAVTNNTVPLIHNAAGTPDRAMTGFSSTGKISFSTPTGSGSPVWRASPTLQGQPKIGAGSGSYSSLDFYDSNGGSGDNFVGLRAPDSLSADVTFVLPGTDGSSGQFLRTNGSGVTSWASAGLTDGDYGSVTIGGSGTTITIDSGAVTDSMLAGSISPSKVTGTAAVLGANTFTAGQTISSGNLSLTGTTPALTLGTGVIQSTSSDTLAFSVNGTARMTIFGSLGFIMTGSDYHDNYTGSFFSSSGSSRDVFFQAAATGIWEQVKSGTQQTYRVYDSSGTKYLQVTHDGTNAEVSASSGAVTIKAGGSTRVIVSASGEVFLNLPTVPGTTGSLYSAGGVVTVSP